ncbi:MAG: hydroxymethylbilane synthase [Chryseobacterium sp.]|nr:MAG: hydroxymethylbilane synthase [Chryseobacterium sp.]
MKTLRIGTRNSPLALWQARQVETRLQALGLQTELVPVVSSGDKNLSQPLYALGITGVFTRDLDVALVNGQIDLAVHSLKDVPTALPHGMLLAAVLERDWPQDVLIRRKEAENLELHELKVATSSLRRRAFWLNQYPEADFSDIRGNVQTRLRKLEEGVADATLLSLAGLNRMDMDVTYEELPFMLPAPAQGVIGVTAMENNPDLLESLQQISHKETENCVNTERKFLQILEGGCTAPIGAFAEMKGNEMRFQGRVCSLDGLNSISVDEIFDWHEPDTHGKMLAELLLNNGGREVMTEIRTQL